MDRANIGFIGCGSHATHNLYPILKYARTNLVAVCDLDAELSRRNAHLFGAERSYTDAEKMLDEEKLDGVLIVGPPHIHYELGLKALARGINVFTEKPPAPELSQVQEMVDAARANNVFLMPGYMKRHGMAYAKARQMIQSGEFAPSAGFFKYGHWPITDLRWMLLAMSSHIIDLAISFFGDVASVHAATHQTDRTLSIALTLKFVSGTWAQLMLDSSQPRIQERVEISGTMDGGNALIVVDDVQHMELHRQGQSGIDLWAKELPDVRPEFDLSDIQLWRPDYGIPNMGQSRSFFQGFAGEVREFTDAILEKREPYPGTADVLKAMQVIEAVVSNPNGSTDIKPLS